MSTNINWRQVKNRYSTDHVGMVGETEMFRVYYDGMRSKGATGGNWTVSSKLSGLRPIFRKTFSGADEAKEYANVQLVHWMEKCGFVFREEQGDSDA